MRGRPATGRPLRRPGGVQGRSHWIAGSGCPGPPAGHPPRWPSRPSRRHAPRLRRRTPPGRTGRPPSRPDARPSRRQSARNRPPNSQRRCLPPTARRHRDLGGRPPGSPGRTGVPLRNRPGRRHTWRRGRDRWCPGDRSGGRSPPWSPPRRLPTPGTGRCSPTAPDRTALRSCRCRPPPQGGRWTSRGGRSGGQPRLRHRC